MKNEMFHLLRSREMRLGLSFHYSLSIPLLELALDYKVDINNFIDNEDTTPLMKTIDFPLSDSITIIKFLLANGANPNHFKKPKSGWWRWENPLAQVLYTHNTYRLIIVQLLLNYGAQVNWKSREDFMTALTPFFSSLPTHHRDSIDNLLILAELLKRGAGSLPALFVDYNKLVSEKTNIYRRYTYLALLGYYFLSKIQQIRFNSVSEIVKNYFPSVLAKIISDYCIDDHNESFNKAVKRLSDCMETNYLDGDHAYRGLDKKPIAWPYPDYPLSLAAYTNSSSMQPLIDAKADVTFIDDNSNLTPLDYAIKRNPDMERDNIGDNYIYRGIFNSESRFERVKIITDTLKDCYRQTLLCEAQRISEVLKAKSTSTITECAITHV